MRPICVPCQRLMPPKKNAYYFEEGMEPTGSCQPPDDLTTATGLSPYKLWVGDMYECPNCGHQVVSGVAETHLAEHYQPDYHEQAKKYPPNIRVR